MSASGASVGAEVVAGRYVLGAAAGFGGMGTVYRATEIGSGRPVAIKVLHGFTPGHAERFAREGRLLSALRHPNIVGFFETGVTARGEPFLAMEWLEGETLAICIDRTRLSPLDASRLVLTVARALEIAHARGIVHRDLKPANLFLVGGDLARVKLLDFGIARAQGESEALTATGDMIGTPGYMPPEQARGQKDMDARCDVFALGCILFRCVTGRAPWTGEPLAAMFKVLTEPPPRLGALAPGVPPALETLVDGMLEKSPADRPRDASVVRAELEAILAGAALPNGYVANRPRVVRQPIAAPRGCLLLAQYPKHAATMAAVSISTPAEREARAADVARSFGGSFSVLAGGSFVVELAANAAPEVVAAQAVRCALALQPAFPEMQIGVVTGTSTGTVAGGTAIDAATELLHAADGPVVAVDDALARLLLNTFPLAPMTGGFRIDVRPSAVPSFGARAVSMRPSGATTAASSAPVRLPLWLGLLLGALTLAIVALVLVFALGSPPGRSASPLPPIADPHAAFTCAFDKCGLVKVPDVHHADPFELLKQARALVSTAYPGARPGSLGVMFSNADGTLDLTTPDALSVSFVTTDAKSSAMVTVQGIHIMVSHTQMVALAPLPDELCDYKKVLGSVPKSQPPIGGYASVVNVGGTMPVYWSIKTTLTDPINLPLFDPKECKPFHF